MTIKITFTRDDATEIAAIEFRLNDAGMNRILDAYREQQAVTSGQPEITRAASAKALSREWVKDLRMRGWNHNAGKVAKVAVDALGSDTEPPEV